MARLRYTAAAREDLTEIAAYIARRSGDQRSALRFTDELRAKCGDLARSSFQLGRARPELGSGLRSSAHKGYVIFFRYRDDMLEIVNILEGHRDIEGFFHEC